MRKQCRRLSLQLLLAIAIGNIACAGESPHIDLHQTMIAQVNPNALALWDVTNKAQDDEGNVDPKKLDAAAWSRIYKMGQALQAGGAMLAKGQIVSAAAGVKLQDEQNAGASKAADVQRFVDSNPAGFRKHAAELRMTGANIMKAASEKDAKKLSEVANSLDQVCESCHTVFWYPQQGGNSK